MHPRPSSLMATLLGLAPQFGAVALAPQRHAEPARKAKRALNKRIGHRQARRQTCNSYALKASRASPAATPPDPTIVA